MSATAQTMPIEDDSVQLRQRAEEARRGAAHAADPIAVETLSAIANAYERLAVRAETKLGASGPGR